MDNNTTVIEDKKIINNTVKRILIGAQSFFLQICTIAIGSSASLPLSRGPSVSV